MPSSPAVAMVRASGLHATACVVPPCVSITASSGCVAACSSRHSKRRVTSGSFRASIEPISCDTMSVRPLDMALVARRIALT